MRILSCSPGYNWKYQDFYYSFDKKIINGLIRAGHSVIPFSDRDFADRALGIRALGKGIANNKLLAIARSYRPELVVLLQADLITNATLRKIKGLTPNCQIVNIDCDLIDKERKKSRLLGRKGIVDATFITSGGFPLAELRKEGLRAAYIPNPTDSSLENEDCYSWSDKFFDLVYFSAAENHAQRWALARRVADLAPDIKVGTFGSDKRRVLGQDYFNVLKSSRTALNWSQRNDVPLYASDRIAQLFGAGICVCLARSTGLEEYLSAKEAIFFNDADDLVQRLRCVKQSGDWIEIGKAGRDRYRALFNETRVASYVIDYASGSSVKDYEWGHV